MGLSSHWAVSRSTFSGSFFDTTTCGCPFRIQVSWVRPPQAKGCLLWQFSLAMKSLPFFFLVGSFTSGSKQRLPNIPSFYETPTGEPCRVPREPRGWCHSHTCRHGPFRTPGGNVGLEILKKRMNTIEVHLTTKKRADTMILNYHKRSLTINSGSMLQPCEWILSLSNLSPAVLRPRTTRLRAAMANRPSGSLVQAGDPEIRPPWSHHRHLWL